MKILALAIGLSFMITGCGTSEHCLDGTKWNSKTTNGTIRAMERYLKMKPSVYEFRNGKIVVRGEANEYRCEGVYIYVKHPTGEEEGKIKGNMIMFKDFVLTKID